MHLISNDLLLSTLAASLFAGIILDYPIYWYMQALRTKMKLPEASYVDNKELMSLSRSVGRLERIMYVFVLALGVPQFIVVWLGMKAVGGLELWNGKHPDEHMGRARYQVYLIGTLLSLAAAYASYYLICLWARANIGR